MTEPSGVQDSAPATAYRPQTQAETQRPGPVQRLAGAKRSIELPYMDLLDHSRRLGRLSRWDWSRTFGGLGVLVLGAGFGAWFSGNDLGSKGVLLGLVAGGILLLSSLFIRRERVESAADLKTDFDQLLSYYEHEDMLREMRERYGTDKPKEKLGALERMRAFLRL